MKKSDGISDILFFDSQEEIKIRGNYVRSVLPLETICEFKGLKKCQIIEHISVELDEESENTYKVEFDDGLQNTVSEKNLTPNEIAKPKDPLHALSSLQHNSLHNFQAREQLNLAYIDT